VYSLTRFELANPDVLHASPAAHFLCSTARIWQEISPASFCSCKLPWRNAECVLLPCFNVQPDIFAVMNCCAVALSMFSSDIITWSTDIVYIQSGISWKGVSRYTCIQCNDAWNKESTCRRICILCQQTSPKRWFGNMNMTSNCGVTNNAHQIKITTTICYWMNHPMKIFYVRQ